MRSPLALLVTTALLLSACDAVVDVSPDQHATAYRSGTASPSDAVSRVPAPSAASCPCFSGASLADTPAVLSTRSGGDNDPYLFFDAFNYYGLDARRTEVRSTFSTREGTYEEVATVYITPDNEGLHLVCFRQDVFRHEASGALTYRYQTLSPTVVEAEACRQDLVKFVGERESCQGAACGIPYSEAQLDPGYPPYNDGTFDTPKSVLDVMRLEVERVGRMIQVPA